MSVIEILTRVDAICKKYHKYDFDKQKHLNLSASDDAALQIGFKPYQMGLQVLTNNLQAGQVQLPAQKSNGQFNSEYFQQTKESSQFRQEYEMQKVKQDQGLEVISEGLDILKNMAHDLNEEMDRQVPLMDEIDTKVDEAASDLKNTNVRLKDTVNQCIEDLR